VKYLAVLFSLILTSCGYRFAATDTVLPKTIHTVAIPPFNNLTIRYKLTDQLPEAISREFLTRTRYKVVSDPNTADAVLRGAVNNYAFNPTIFDPATGRAAYAELRVTVTVSLTERATGKILFERKGFEVRETYQISPNATQYFEESDPALKRAGQQVARSVVSAVLENF
jgi:outer membrane lipopolysaccharide assembly protein LptE/RlpB